MAEKQSAGEVTFQTTLSAFGNNTGIEVSAAVLEQLGAGSRPPLMVEVNGYAYQTTAGVMRGTTLVPVSAAIRKKTGLKGGDAITVTLRLATEKKSGEVPDDFAAALAAAGVRPFFDNLSNSVQRYHIDTVNGAKAVDTRARRIEKAVATFRAGKPR